jgi:hypothetical protein
VGDAPGGGTAVQCARGHALIDRHGKVFVPEASELGA